MISDVLKQAIAKAAGKIGGKDAMKVSFSVEHPDDMSHGDYSTNAALILAKNLKGNPRDIADRLVAELRRSDLRDVERIEMAVPGFINFFLKKAFFTAELAAVLKRGEEFGRSDSFKNSGLKKVMIEYTQPNPFKEFHIGHLMNNAVGESISRLVESQGSRVKRATYHGDVGLHVAKAIWALQKNGGTITVESLGESYAKGNAAYDNDEKAKAEITALNKVIYDKSNPAVDKLYDEGRRVSLAHFEGLYRRLGSSFDYHFFESAAGKVGKELVAKFLKKGVFEASEGAVVFHAEKYGLHTRVFLNKEGLPTYEAKELGLAELKRKVFRADRYVTITANEQDDFFKVAEKAAEEVFGRKHGTMSHVSHGMLRLKSGKMSSRTGTIIAAEDFIDDVKSSVYEKIADREFSAEEKDAVAESVALAAIKYTILRQTTGGGIIFDPEKSISFEGDSGPYLQYSAVRARSALAKASAAKIVGSVKKAPPEAYPLERMLYRLPEIVARAANEHEPHHLTTYLTELAGAFNGFYANEQIVSASDEFSPYKIALTRAFLVVMENGLGLLGIKVPNKM